VVNGNVGRGKEEVLENRKVIKMAEWEMMALSREIGLGDEDEGGFYSYEVETQRLDER
jgi:hypothetical protein